MQEGVVHLMAIPAFGSPWHLDTYRSKSKKEGAEWHLKALTAGKAFLYKRKVGVCCSMSDACNTMMACGSLWIAKVALGAPKCLCHAAQNVLKPCFSSKDLFPENLPLIKNVHILNNAISRGQLRHFVDEYQVEKEIKERMQRKHSLLEAGSVEFVKQQKQYVAHYNRRHGAIFANQYALLMFDHLHVLNRVVFRTRKWSGLVMIMESLVQKYEFIVRLTDADQLLRTRRYLVTKVDSAQFNLKGLIDDEDFWLELMDVYKTRLESQPRAQASVFRSKQTRFSAPEEVAELRNFSDFMRTWAMM